MVLHIISYLGDISKPKRLYYIIMFNLNYIQYPGVIFSINILAHIFE